MTSTSSPAARFSLLSSSGLQVAIGPFLVHVRSDLVGVNDYIGRLYTDFPVASSPGGHFDVSIVNSGGVRRFVRPQANISINGAKPFLPLPATIAGAAFEWALNWCVGNHAHHYVAVHAAVVERRGRALILSAHSGAGKSTLCAALVLAGWRLFSDEFALIDPDTGRLSPLPRPISLKEAAIEIIKGRAPQAAFGPEGHDIEDERFVHMKPPTESVRRAREEAIPGWIVVPRWVPGKPTTIEPLPKAHALLHLTDQSFNYNYLGTRGFECIADLVSRSACYTLEYSDLDDVLARLAAMADS